MKKILFLLALSTAVTACGEDDVKKIIDVTKLDPEAPKDPTDPTDPPIDTEITVSGEITENTTWKEATKVTLEGKVSVVPGVTLTIEQGVLIVGNKSPLSWLQVQRGAKISAIGTAEKPIVFTSSKPAGSRQSGDWGGLVILGKATNNMGTEVALEGNGGSHGGTIDNDSSGTLKYVRVEFAGWELAPGNELNGITLGSAGSGTLLDHVQVHYGLDDGIEWFGGAANGRYLVVTGTDDDCFDWDEGYHGKLQFLVCLHSDTRGDRGFEGAGNKNTFTATPLADPIVYNYTFSGRGVATGYTSSDRGVTIKEGSRGQLHNGIIIGFGKSAFDIDDLDTAQAAGVSVSNTIVYGNGTTDSTSTNQIEVDSDGLDELAEVWNAGTNNKIEDPGVTVNLAAPSLVPSTVITGATPPSDGFFDASATHIGAFGTTNWLTGWTRFSAN